MLAPGTRFSMRICSAIHSLSCQQRASGNIMAKPRVTATDRLANMIEVVELGQRTGLLSVERGSGSVLEEGALYFASGRVMYASLAGLRGREALAALGRWGACRFSFDSNVQPPIPNITAAFPIPNMPPDMRRGASPPPSGPPSSFPGQRRGDSGVWPSQPGIGQAGNGYAGNGYAGNSYAENGSAGTGYGANPAGRSGYALGTAILGGAGNSNVPRPLTPTPTPGTGYLGASQPQTGALNRRPRRAPDVRDLMAVVTTHNLSRRHRTILLLADGEHTVLDLARLSSKSVDEVSMLLGELETRGLIYYYS